jgi:hypothetical protein
MDRSPWQRTLPKCMARLDQHLVWGPTLRLHCTQNRFPMDDGWTNWWGVLTPKTKSGWGQTSTHHHTPWGSHGVDAERSLIGRWFTWAHLFGERSQVPVLRWVENIAYLILLLQTSSSVVPVMQLTFRGNIGFFFMLASLDTHQFVGSCLKERETSHLCRIFAIKFRPELGTNVSMAAGELKLLLYMLHFFYQIHLAF